MRSEISKIDSLANHENIGNELPKVTISHDKIEDIFKNVFLLEEKRWNLLEIILFF